MIYDAVPGRWRAALLALALVMVAPASARAQDVSLETLLDRLIVRVAVLLDGRRTTAPEIVALVQTRVGEPLRMADVRETVFHLASVRRFTNIEAEGVPDDGGVALTYRMAGARAISRLEFRGAPQVSAGQLRAVVGTRAFGPPTNDRIGDAERALLAFYRSLGYFSPNVSTAVENLGDGTRAQLAFTIQPGARARVAAIDVRAEGATRQDVLARIGLDVGDFWDLPALERKGDAYVRRLRQGGYFEAAISFSAHPREGEREVDVTVGMDRGPRVELAFEGDEIPERQRRELVSVEREGSVDEDLLEDSAARIERWLREQGHARATVSYDRVESAGTLRIIFRVTRGPMFVVDAVHVEGVDASRQADVHALTNLKPGSPFVQNTLATTASAVTEFYRRQGFVGVEVHTIVDGLDAAAGSSGPVAVRPRIVVRESERTSLGQVVFNGVRAVPERELRALLTLTTGSPFYPPELLRDRNAIAGYYVNHGYRDVRVDAVPRASDTPRAIDVVYEVTEGPQQVVGHVLISGQRRTSAETIGREAALIPGTPLGADELVDAQRRLSSLGLFRRVRVDDLPRPGRRATDVLLDVEEAPPTNIGYGAGLEGGRRLVRDPNQDGAAVEKFEVSPRGFFEIGRRNLWGKNRSVNLFTRLSLRNRGGTETGPTDVGSSFYEYRVVGTYREPRVFETGVDAQINGFLEQGVRTSFNFARQGVNAEFARRVGPTLTLVGRYIFGETQLYDQRIAPEDKPIVDRLYPQVRLSSFSGVLVRDTRDDPLEPTRGVVTNVEGELAARALGSEVGFVKAFLQGFVYRRVPGSARVIFAGGARLGLATSFTKETVDTPGGGVEVRLTDLPASERFYAGGSTTARGWALDRLGDDATIDPEGFPLGGNALVLLNGELRFPVWRAAGGVLFVDAGNVFARAEDLDLGRLRGSGGAGLRYRSPIGPVRADVGFKFDRRTFSGGQRERGWELHISLGQAF